MDVLRTPDDRFAGLPDYSFQPHYVSVPAARGTPLRLHYLDEGPRDGAVVLLMHGEPSWSFLNVERQSGLLETHDPSHAHIMAILFRCHLG